MQRVVIDQPYEFIPPRHSRFWHAVVRRVLPRLLRKDHGVTAIECLGVDKLRASISAGHGIILAPNHCRPCDPLVMDSLAAAARRPFHIIASRHVFMQNRLQRFLLPRLGGFSVHREGMDRESLKCAVHLVAEGKHPLVIFPEGIITRCNDRLANLMDGPSFIARAAARQRKQGKVVIHPVFIRYFFEGNLRETVLPVVEEIERRLTWLPQTHLGLRERITKTGGALLALKEMEYLGQTRSGDLTERLHHLQDHLLLPMEDTWAGGRHDGDAVARIKRLRSAILPDLVSGSLTEKDRTARWRLLADLYLVQQLHGYPGDYFENLTPERVLETVERYEEDLTDAARPHAPIRAILTVGDPIEAQNGRGKSAENDALTQDLRTALEHMMQETRELRRHQPTGTDLG